MAHYEYMTLIPDLRKPFSVKFHRLLVPIKCKTIKDEFELKFKALPNSIITNNIPKMVTLQWENMQISYITDKLLMKTLYRGVKTFHTIPTNLN